MCVGMRNVLYNLNDYYFVVAGCCKDNDCVTFSIRTSDESGF